VSAQAAVLFVRAAVQDEADQREGRAGHGRRRKARIEQSEGRQGNPGENQTGRPPLRERHERSVVAVVADRNRLRRLVGRGGRQSL
jgi:hypothetical protein